MLVRAALVLCAMPLVASCETGPELIPFSVVSSFPHDPDAYTQGLLFHDGHLYESTGRLGQSTVRRAVAETGAVVAQTALDSLHFGEGLARVNNELYQLTWKAGTALVYDLESLELVRTYRYDGEGWGLCFDGSHLYMSNGSSTLLQRDPSTFAVTGEVLVSGHDLPIHQLNELECVGQSIFANVFQSDRILEIDKTTGRVTREIDGSSLSIAGGRPPDPAAVLNGIAYVPETGILLVTGKLWPRVLALRLER